MAVVWGGSSRAMEAYPAYRPTQARRRDESASIPALRLRGRAAELVRGVLERVVERRERARREPSAVAVEPVGEPGVLGQQRAVQVGADDVRARRRGRPRIAAAPSLPWPAQHAARAARSPAPRRVRPPWFSKPASTARAAGREVDLDRDVADQPRAVLAHGLEVDEADARERSSPSS